MAQGQSNYDGPKSCYVNFPCRPKFEAGAAFHGGVYFKLVNSSPIATYRELECRRQHIFSYLLLRVLSKLSNSALRQSLKG